MSAVTLTESSKVREWLRYLKGQPAEYRMKCLRAIYRSDGAVVLNKCLASLGWERSADMVIEVEKESNAS